MRHPAPLTALFAVFLSGCLAGSAIYEELPEGDGATPTGDPETTDPQPTDSGDSVEPTDAEPPDTGDPTSPLPRFSVLLTDGDATPDAVGGFDLDTITAIVQNPPPGDWFFGYAQTEVGAVNGWFEESCEPGSSFCHPLSEPFVTNDVRQSVVVLTRVASIADIVEGSTTLLPVDFPVSTTPDLTFYFGDQAGSGLCAVFGDDPTYYASLGCLDATLFSTTNQ